MVEFRKLTWENDNMRECLRLKVAEEQQNFVADNRTSIIEAYLSLVDGEPVAAYAIYADTVMVGFIKYTYSPEIPEKPDGVNIYVLWRLMIDEKYQGRGYGKQALLKFIDEVKTKPFGEADYIDTRTSNPIAKKLYESVGFFVRGMIIDDEILLRLDISSG